MAASSFVGTVWHQRWDPGFPQAEHDLAPDLFLFCEVSVWLDSAQASCRSAAEQEEEEEPEAPHGPQLGRGEPHATLEVPRALLGAFPPHPKMTRKARRAEPLERNAEHDPTGFPRNWGPSDGAAQGQRVSSLSSIPPWREHSARSEAWAPPHVAQKGTSRSDSSLALGLFPVVTLRIGASSLPLGASPSGAEGSGFTSRVLRGLNVMQGSRWGWLLAQPAPCPLHCPLAGPRPFFTPSSSLSDTMIMDSIAAFLVLPNRLLVPLVPDLQDVAQLRSPLPRVGPRLSPYLPPTGLGSFRPLALGSFGFSLWFPVSRASSGFTCWLLRA